MGIHPTAIVDKNAQVADGVSIGARCIIGPKVKLEKDVKIHNNVIIEGETIIGEGTEVCPFTLIGVSSQHARFINESGKVTIGKFNVIEKHVTVHVGTPIDLDNTIIGDHCVIKINAHIAHDCIVGNHVILENVATLGGHVHLGDYVHAKAMAVFHQFIRVGKYAKICDMAGGFKDIIPYGVKTVSRGKTLAGLNIEALEKNGVSKEEIKNFEDGCLELFVKEGTQEERLIAVKEKYKTSKFLQEVIEFMTPESKFGYYGYEGNESA